MSPNETNTSFVSYVGCLRIIYVYAVLIKYCRPEASFYPHDTWLLVWLIAPGENDVGVDGRWVGTVPYRPKGFQLDSHDSQPGACDKFSM